MKFDYKKLAKAITDKKFEISFDQKKNIGLRKLSKSAGVSAATLSRILNGNKADIDTVLSICHWLKTDINEYVTKK